MRDRLLDFLDAFVPVRVGVAFTDSRDWEGCIWGLEEMSRPFDSFIVIPVHHAEITELVNAWRCAWSLYENTYDLVLRKSSPYSFDEMPMRLGKIDEEAWEGGECWHSTGGRQRLYLSQANQQIGKEVKRRGLPAYLIRVSHKAVYFLIRRFTINF